MVKGAVVGLITMAPDAEVVGEVKDPLLLVYVAVMLCVPPSRLLTVTEAVAEGGPSYVNGNIGNGTDIEKVSLSPGLSGVK